MKRLIDESPLWLAAVGRNQEARVVLKKIAKYNNEKYDEEDFKQIEEKEDCVLKSKTNVDTEEVWGPMLRKPVMVVYILINILSW